MDRLVYSDEVLNKQICSECSNYLSVGPVLVSSEEQILCGRCNKNMTAATKGPKYSLYNLVAESMVFKCINHYEGCKEPIFFNEAKEHEKNCQKNGLECPFCSFKGNGCQLVRHFDKEHPAEVVKGDTFKIIFKDNFSKRLVYVKNSRILCLSIFMHDTFIDIFNFLLTPANLECEHFSLKFFKSDTLMQCVTPPIRITHDLDGFLLSAPLTEIGNCKKSCFVLDQAEIVNCFPARWCMCKIEFINKLDRESDENLNWFNRIIRKIGTESSTHISERSLGEGFVGEEFNPIDYISNMSVSNLREFVNTELAGWQKCSNCKLRIYGTAFYLCPKFHISCQGCTTKKCPRCKTFCKWTNKSKIHTLTLTCEWKGCDFDVFIFDYVEHKKYCKHRQYKCPDSECGFIGSRNNLKAHWHLAPIRFEGPVKVSPESCCAFYWLWWADLYYVTTEFEEISGKFSVTVSEVDVILHKTHLLAVRVNKAGKAECDADFVKTQTDLLRRNESICFVKFLKKEEMEKDFSLSSGDNNF